MELRRHQVLMAAACGLAVSAASEAQPFAIVSNLPGTWTEIRPTAAQISIHGSNDSVEPFTSSVTNALITRANLIGSTNGYITDAIFNENTTSNNTPLPVANGIGNPPVNPTFGLFPFWDYTYGGGLWHQNIIENGISTEVIEWYEQTSPGGSLHGSFQVKIFASGPILAQYLYKYPNPSWMGGGSSATIGVQWPTGYQQYSYNTSSITTYIVLSVVFNSAYGACCLMDGSCILASGAGCHALTGGVYRGDGTACETANCPQPLTGACCLPTLTCAVLWQGACTAAGGIYHGDGATCDESGCPVGWHEQHDTGEFQEYAQAVMGVGPVAGIFGRISHLNDVDMYKIQICDAAHFSATTVNAFTWTGMDTELWLFDSTGHGVTANEDDAQDPTGQEIRSRLSSQFIPGNGVYYLVVTGHRVLPLDVGTPPIGPQMLWLNGIPDQLGFPHFNIEHAPDGPAAGNAIDSWGYEGSVKGDYLVSLTGVCFMAPVSSCYANCDNSTTSPVLNVADFTCFLQKFAAGCR